MRARPARTIVLSGETSRAAELAPGVRSVCRLRLCIRCKAASGGKNGESGVPDVFFLFLVLPLFILELEVGKVFGIKAEVGDFLACIGLGVNVRVTEGDIVQGEHRLPALVGKAFKGVG